MKIKNLSVVFPFFNESLRVNECFKNIQNFNRKNKLLNCEYVFVDDGSNDNTSNKIRNFIKSQKKKKKKFKLIKLNENSGKGEALKKGIFGAPTFSVNKKIFWGQDRLSFAIDEAKK